ncbi:MAG: DUF805 domain-containing protein [Bacteroidales bacterium]|nr:DUF805 domain-containing protein [Bacteroidales bacterium]
MAEYNSNGFGGNTQPQGGFGGGMNGAQPPMTFLDAVKVCFNKYADFNGRASRAEFWWFWLFQFVAGFICGMISQWLGGICSLALIVPSLAVAWRRLHDIGRAGGWFFIGLIPLVGWIIMIIWYVKPGEPTANRFGNPVA